MKKKLKDLTLDDCNKICDSMTECDYCPLRNVKQTLTNMCWFDRMTVQIDFDENKEVELDETDN